MTCHLLMKMTILQKCTHYCNSGIATPICFLKGRFHLTQHDQKLFHRNHYIYKQTKTTTDLWHNKTANNFRHIINIYLKLAFVTVAILSLVFSESKNNWENQVVTFVSWRSFQERCIELEEVRTNDMHFLISNLATGEDDYHD